MPEPFNRQHSTIRDHMPAHHRFRDDWTPERIRRQAVRFGPNVEVFVDVVMRQRRHPEQAYRSCLGVIKLAKAFGSDRLDAACARALESNAQLRLFSNVFVQPRELLAVEAGGFVEALVKQVFGVHVLRNSTL